MTPELRHGLFSVDPVSLGALHLDEYEKEKAAMTKSGVVEPDETKVQQLLQFSVDESVARYALVQTKNASVEEVFDYISSNGEEIARKLASEANELPKKKAPRPRVIPLELQKLFTYMKTVDMQALMRVHGALMWSLVGGARGRPRRQPRRRPGDADPRRRRHRAGEPPLRPGPARGRLVLIPWGPPGHAT